MIFFGNQSDISSATTSLNNNGNLVLVSVTSTSNDVTGITYAGVAMTQLGTVLSNAGGRFASSWALLNATPGTNNVSVTGGANLDGSCVAIGGVASYGAQAQNSGNSGTATVSVTTATKDAYVVGFEFSSNTGTASTNTTLFGSSSYRSYYRSTNAVTTPGALSLNVTFTSNQWNFNAIAVYPLEGNFLSFM